MTESSSMIAVFAGSRTGRLRAVALSILFVLVFLFPTAALAAPYCGDGETPEFRFGFAHLKSLLDDEMGVPIECEHANPENGDTLQQTSTGLSFYRKATNTPTFTDGWNHWAWTTDGLVYWSGSSIDPPGLAVGGPQNGRIAFVSYVDGNQEIYSIGSDGSGLTRLTWNGAEDYSPDWSPDGTQIAFVSERDGTSNIYVMNADGNEVIQITDSPVKDTAPDWSPSGDRIAFARDLYPNLNSTSQNADIYLMDPDGSNVTRLTYNTTMDGYPAWSRDGLRIAFTSMVPQSGGINFFSVMTADGIVEVEKANGRDPSWLLDVSGIVLTDMPFMGPYDLFIAQPDGTESQRIPLNGLGGWNPDVSPDGEQIVFDTRGSFWDTGRDGYLYTIGIDGTGVTLLTEFPGWQPSWASLP